MRFSKAARIVFILLLSVGSARTIVAQTSQRSMQDWISANLAAADIVWLDSEAAEPSPRIFFDLFGIRNTLYHLNLGTQVDGTISETRLDSGRARVHIVQHSSQVLSYATVSNGLIFGHFPAQVAGGADVALGATLLTVDFENSAPGAPLPSLNALSFDTQNPNFKLEKIGLTADADGRLRAAFGVPEGTPGKAHTTQRGLYNAPGMHVGDHDVFAAEKVDIRPVP